MMKKMIVAVFVLGALFSTKSSAQFKEAIAENILTKIANSKGYKLNREQLRLIVQDAIDGTVIQIMNGPDKSKMIHFLYQAKVISLSEPEYFTNLFGPEPKYSQAVKVKEGQYLRELLDREKNKIMIELNEQIGVAIIDAYQIGSDDAKLAKTILPESVSKTVISKMMKHREMGAVFLKTSQKYVQSVNVNTVDDMLDVQTSIFRHYGLSGRTYSATTDDIIINSLKKLF